MATNLPRKLFSLMLVLQTASGETSLFQCPFQQQSGFLYTPNIPDSYFNEGITNDDVIISQFGVTYIFTIPSESTVQRNCSGRVMSIQYCYQARNEDIGNTQDVFRFLSLTQDGLQFTVSTNVIIQTTPLNSICSDFPGSLQQICCDTTSLSVNDQFQIPPSTYTFGIVIVNNNVKLLAFTNNVRVEQYQVSLGPSIPPGSKYTLTENAQVNRSLLLLRFLIVSADREIVTETTQQNITEVPTDREIVTEPESTTQLNITEVPTDREAVTEPESTTQLNITEAQAELTVTVISVGIGIFAILVISLLIVLSIAFIRRKNAEPNVTPFTGDLPAVGNGNGALTNTYPSIQVSHETTVPLFLNQSYASAKDRTNISPSAEVSHETTVPLFLNQANASIKNHTNSPSAEVFHETTAPLFLNQSYASVKDSTNTSPNTEVSHETTVPLFLNQSYASTKEEPEYASID